MRTGLIPQSHASVETAGTPLDAPRPSEYERKVVRERAAILAEIVDAANTGNVTRVLTLAVSLGAHEALHADLAA